MEMTHSMHRGILWTISLGVEILRERPVHPQPHLEPVRIENLGRAGTGPLGDW